MADSTNLIEPFNYGDSFLIIENVGENLAVQNTGQNGTVLEGVCAVFGEMNNNRRVYEKDEYLPHLSYLQDKIKKRQLLGDLDHPQHFEVTLKSASHIVEALSYDGGNRVNIKLRILESTPNGKIAKALLDGGVNLSISSRAAGSVNESGRVKLQRIFTYDLVGEPGFTEAILRKTINESLKSEFQLITESYNHLKETSVIHTENLVEVSESLNFADNFKIYKINKKNNEIGNIINPTLETQKNNSSMSEFITRNQMDQYSELLKNQFAGIKKELKAHKSLLESKGSSNGEESKLVDFVNYLAEQLEGVVNYSQYLSDKVNESIRYTEHVAETTNNSIEYSSYLAEKVNQSIKYQDFIAEKVNQTINYSEYIKENLNNSIKYQNYIAEELDRGLQYTEYVAEGANRGIEYAEYVAEHSNYNRDYAQYLGEQLSKSIGYTEYVAESFNGVGGEIPKRNLLNGVSKVDESTSIDNLLSKVDTVITEITSNSAKSVLESRYPFLKVMSDAKKNAFYNLDTDTKNAIVETLSGAIWFNENDVVGIMEAVINNKDKNVPAYIKFMPDSYKEAWSTMNENEKNRIHAKAQLYSINTPYQASSFWGEMDLRGINERIELSKNNIRLEKINESQSTEGMVPLSRVVENTRGYSQAYLDMLARQATYRR